ncbi:MAG: RluA family pseudouridine synthase [Parachlamydiales bacterium]|nr:RluA family pseudouridine synthase [Parachlamydiales bacterium]
MPKKLFTWTVSPEDQGVSVLRFLQKNLHTQKSIRMIKKAVELGMCSINGQIELFSSKKVSVYDHIYFHHEWERFVSLPSIKSPTVLYEDSFYMIVDKPIHLSCDPKMQSYFSVPIYLVHRLDKMTSGCLILAKNPVAKNKMEQLFRSQQIDKRYIAIVDRPVREKKFVCENYLTKKCSFQGQTLYQVSKKRGGVFAKTYFVSIKTYHGVSLLLCHPITGKTHQIRVHLSSLGHPILGDYLYERRFSYSDFVPRLLLHSYELSFIHPFTRKRMRIQAPIPEIFHTIISFKNSEVFHGKNLDS